MGLHWKMLNLRLGKTEYILIYVCTLVHKHLTTCRSGGVKTNIYIYRASKPGYNNKYIAGHAYPSDYSIYKKSLL